MATRETTLEKLERLKQARTHLKTALTALGEDSGAPNGVDALAGKVETATVLDDNMTATVTSTGSVYKGDLVSLTRELTRAGEPLRIANGNATMLGAVSLGNVMVICFTQDDDTFLKTAKWSGGEWTLGPTVTMLEGPLEKAVLVPFALGDRTPGYDTETHLAVFYLEDSVGTVEFWKLNALTMTLEGRDFWTDTALTNLCGAWSPRMVRYSQAGAPDGVTFRREPTLTIMGQNGAGKIVATALNLNGGLSNVALTTVTIAPGSYTGPTYFQNQKLQDFAIPEADSGDYACSAWALLGAVGHVWLAFPGADGERYLLNLWLKRDETIRPNQSSDYTPVGCRKFHLGGALPCGAVIPWFNISGIGKETALLLTGLSRYNGKNNQKSSLGVENWYIGLGDGDLAALWFGENDQSYQTNIGLVSGCRMGAYSAAAGYSAEGSYKALVLYEKNGTLTGGPSVDLGEVGTAAQLLPWGSQMAALAYQKADSVYLQALALTERVASVTDSEMADGIAVTGGKPGTIIRLKAV